MSLEDHIKEIRNCLRDPNKIEEALKKLDRQLGHHLPKELPRFRPLQVSYLEAFRDYTSQTLDRNQYDLKRNQVIQGAERLLILLEEKVYESAQLHVRLEGELAKINCDRRKIIKQFRLRFQEKEDKEQQVQFYFLVRQQYGQAESLVKRLIYELANFKKAVKVDRQILIREVDIEPHDGIEECVRLSLFEFNRGLDPDIDLLEEFAEGIDLKYPSFKSGRYLPFVFKVRLRLDCWHRVGEALMEWFIEEFSPLEQTISRRFIFFFIFELRQAKEKEKKGWFSWSSNKKTKLVPEEDMFGALLKLQQAWPEKATAFPALQLVREEDLFDWYKFFEKNEMVREEKVEALTRKLGKGPWPMALVERELESIVDEYRAKQADI